MSTSVSIFDLFDIGGAPATNDVTVVVDVSDTTQSPQGSTKKMLISELFTSVTITTSLAVTGTAAVSGNFAVNTDKFTVTAASGNTAVAGTLAVTGDTSIAGKLVMTGDITFNGRTQLQSPSNGLLLVTNAAGTDFTRMQFGGSTASFPAIKRNGAALNFVLADDSSHCDINANAATLTSTLTAAGATLSGALSGTSAAFSSTLSAIGSIGYATGAGGTVTQGNSSGRSTAVTINKLCGQITTDNTLLNVGNIVSFTVNNTTVAAGDTVVVAIKSGTSSTATMIWVGAVANNSFAIRTYNITGTETGSIVINFVVLKSVTS